MHTYTVWTALARSTRVSPRGGFSSEAAAVAWAKASNEGAKGVGWSPRDLLVVQDSTPVARVFASGKVTGV